MKKLIKDIKILRRIYDAYLASKYFNNRYLKILKCAIRSNENTDYTYKLSKKNQLELIKIFKDSTFEQIKFYLQNQGSVVLIRSLMKNKEEGYAGYYYGTNINPEAGYLLNGDYNKHGEILYEDSIERLNKMTNGIDLFINDSDHSAECEFKEYLAIKNKLSKTEIILGDNSYSTDKQIKFSIENNRRYILFKEEPINYWYSWSGIGISYT